MRILFLLDSFKNVPAAINTISLAREFIAGGSEAGIISFRPGGKLLRQAKQENLPIRVQQFFDSHLSFYAPGLTGAVLFFRPEAVIFCSAGTLLHGGPLSRAFKGLQMFSIAPIKNRPIWFSRHALRRMQQTFAPDEQTRKILEKILPKEKISELTLDNLVTALLSTQSGVQAEQPSEEKQDTRP